MTDFREELEEFVRKYVIKLCDEIGMETYDGGYTISLKATKAMDELSNAVEEKIKSIAKDNDYIVCGLCDEIIPQSDSVRELNFGHICNGCLNSLISRGEKVFIVYNDYDD